MEVLQRSLQHLADVLGEDEAQIALDLRGNIF
jgi:hypothetical protein